METLTSTEIIAANSDDKLKTLADRLAHQRQARYLEIVQKYAVQSQLARSGDSAPDHSASSAGKRAARLGNPALRELTASAKFNQAAARFRPLPAEEVLALASQFQKKGDWENAAAAYAALVGRRILLEEILPQLEMLIAQAPLSLPLLQLLGDAYLRSQRAQQAREVYGLALRHITGTRLGAAGVALHWKVVEGNRG